MVDRVHRWIVSLSYSSCILYSLLLSHSIAYPSHRNRLRMSVAGLTPEEVQETVTQILRSLGVSGEDAEVREEVFVELMMQMDAFVASVFDVQSVHDHDGKDEGDDEEDEGDDEGEDEEVEAVRLSDEDLQALFDDLVQQEADSSAASKKKQTNKKSSKQKTVSGGTLLQWTALKELVDSGDLSVSSLQQLLRRLSISAASEEPRLDLDGFKALCRQILEHSEAADEAVDGDAEEAEDGDEDDEESEEEYEEVDEEEIRSAFDEMFALQQQDQRSSSSQKRSSKPARPSQTPLLTMETMKRHWPLLQQVLADEMLTEQSLVRILDSIAHPEDDHTSPARPSDEVRALTYEGFAEFYRLLVDAADASAGVEEDDDADDEEEGVVDEEQDLRRVDAANNRPAAGEEDAEDEDVEDEDEDDSEVG